MRPSIISVTNSIVSLTFSFGIRASLDIVKWLNFDSRQRLPPQAVRAHEQQQHHRRWRELQYEYIKSKHFPCNFQVLASLGSDFQSVCFRTINIWQEKNAHVFINIYILWKKKKKCVLYCAKWSECTKIALLRVHEFLSIRFFFFTLFIHPRNRWNFSTDIRQYFFLLVSTFCSLSTSAPFHPVRQITCFFLSPPNHA